MNFYKAGQIWQEFVTFLVFFGCVAVVFVFTVRAIDTVTKPPTSANGPLVLSLEPESEFCVTPLPRWSDGVKLWANKIWDPSEYVFQVHGLHVVGWHGVPTLNVKWRVSGGDPPYEIEVDGRRGDVFVGPYVEADGVAQVGCAETSAAEIWVVHGTVTNRPSLMHMSEPSVGPRWKAVKAKVRDREGRTAQAEAYVYVAVDADSLFREADSALLSRKSTYYLRGHLLTTPSDYDVELLALDSEVGCRDTCTVGFSLVGVNATIVLYEHNLAEINRWMSGPSAKDANVAAKVERALDELVDSVDKPPRHSSSPPPSPSSTFADGDH